MRLMCTKRAHMLAWWFVDTGTMWIYVCLKIDNANFNVSRSTTTRMSFGERGNSALKGCEATGQHAHTHTADVITGTLTRRGTPCFIKRSGLGLFLFRTYMSLVWILVRKYLKICWGEIQNVSSYDILYIASLMYNLVASSRTDLAKMKCNIHKNALVSV